MINATIVPRDREPHDAYLDTNTTGADYDDDSNEMRGVNDDGGDHEYFVLWGRCAELDAFAEMKIWF